MPRTVRLRISLYAALPALLPALVILSAMAVAGLVPWTVPPSVALALTVQSLITFIRLGRIPDTTAGASRRA
ncbi:hypothetical protein [Streptomyces sp. GS7]|uniref:hypothetical protein n=1 Tax=Streptomyces sp. GS7 TaxID=2692234 RepID=UPI00131811DE|nr:hypothetical protein [Streptomyces sp. GS7]QHC22828.1 hypothetical protein GR130_16710 [Streptomyces sp. GS7]